MFSYNFSLFFILQIILEREIDYFFVIYCFIHFPIFILTKLLFGGNSHHGKRGGA